MRNEATVGTPCSEGSNDNQYMENGMIIHQTQTFIQEVNKRMYISGHMGEGGGLEGYRGVIKRVNTE